MASIWDRLRSILRRGTDSARPGPASDPRAYFARPQNWTPVESSNLHSVAYFTDLRQTSRGNVLGVRFKDARRGISEYHLYGVPLGVWTGLMAASSKGKYYWANIRDRYYFERVR